MIGGSDMQKLKLNIQMFSADTISSVSNLFHVNGSATYEVLPSIINTTNYINFNLNMLLINNMDYICYNLNNLQTFDTSTWQSTSAVNSWVSAFANCMSLSNLNVSTWNLYNAINLYHMFENCKSLTNIDITNWNIYNATNIASMFVRCDNIQSLNFNSWNISKVTDLGSLFAYCNNLDTIEWSNNWLTNNISSLQATFAYCNKLTDLNIANWNTSNVTTIAYICTGCKNLQNLDISEWDLSNVTSYTYAFAQCNNLTNMTLENICQALARINAQGKIFNNLYNTNSSGPFYLCNKEVGLNSISLETAIALNQNGWIFSGTQLPLNTYILKSVDENSVCTIQGYDDYNDIKNYIQNTTANFITLDIYERRD